MKRFCCPKCQNDIAEEVVFEGVICNEVNGSCEGDLDYGNCGEVEGGYIDRYQCKSCGYVIPKIHTPEEMVKWIEENGKEQ